jgi:hypothetical protein
MRPPGRPSSVESRRYASTDTGQADLL